MSVFVYCYILPSSVIPRAIYQRQSFQALTDLQERQSGVQFQVFPLNSLRKSENPLLRYCCKNDINNDFFLQFILFNDILSNIAIINPRSNRLIGLKLCPLPPMSGVTEWSSIRGRTRVHHGICSQCKQ